MLGRLKRVLPAAVPADADPAGGAGCVPAQVTPMRRVEDEQNASLLQRENVVSCSSFSSATAHSGL